MSLKRELKRNIWYHTEPKDNFPIKEAIRTTRLFNQTHSPWYRPHSVGIWEDRGIPWRRKKNPPRREHRQPAVRSRRVAESHLLLRYYVSRRFYLDTHVFHDRFTKHEGVIMHRDSQTDAIEPLTWTHRLNTHEIMFMLLVSDASQDQNTFMLYHPRCFYIPTL